MHGRDLIVNGEIMLHGMVMSPEEAAFWEDGFSALMVAQALGETSGPVTVRVNSYGGIATEGEAIRSLFARHPADVTCVIEGMCASAASLMVMGADRREMSDGSFLMIHDPSGMAWGTEDEIARESAVLGKLGAAYAAVYASVAGMTPDEARALMRAETWMTAEEAAAAGFVDAVTADDGVTAPEDVSSAQRLMTQRRKDFAQMKREKMAAPAPSRVAAKGGAVPAHEGSQKEVEMAEETTAPAAPAGEHKAKLTLTEPTTMSAADVLRQDRERRAAIRTMAAKFVANGTLKEADVTEMAEDETVTEDKARAMILDKLTAAQSPEIGRPGARMHITADGVDRTHEGLKRALMGKVGLKDGERNEFSGYRLVEMARESLRAHNMVPRGDRQLDMVGAAFTMSSGGAHSTSDFTSILADVANKSMLKGYEEWEETFPRFTSVGSLTDFKPTKRVGMDAFPVLSKVVEDAEFTYGTLGDYAESAVLATYGKLFKITRQAIINDDLDAFSKIPMKAGRASKRTVGDLVFAILTGTVTMADGISLFHTDHNNLATSAGGPSETSFDVAYRAMMSQTDRSQTDVKLNIQPAFGLFPLTWRATALQTLDSERAPDDTAKAGSTKQPYAANTAYKMVQPIFDARLSGNAWFFAANPQMHDTIEVSYLDGQQEPFLDEQDGWSVDGVEYKVRLDVAATALDWKALYKNAGS